MKTLRKIVSKITILGIVMTLMIPNVANAATLTNAKDELSTNKASVVANHTIYFETPTGISGGQTMVLTMTGFSIPVSSPVTEEYKYIDIAEGTTAGDCTGPSAVAYTEKNLLAAAATTTWGAVRTSATVITFQAGSAGITADRCVRIKIGTHATSEFTGGYQITNATAGSNNIQIGGGASTMTDSTYIAVAMVTDPQVDLTASVGTSLTMSLSGTTASLGTLSTGSTITATTTVTINTNSGLGYALKYSATPLTNQIGSNNVIAALGSETLAAPNTEQWGLNAATTVMTGTGDTNGVTNTSYDESGKYMVVTTSTDTLLATGAGLANAHAYTVTYGVDIGALTPAGSYTGNVDFIVYGTF